MNEKFAPSILVDGITLTPEGWMWVLGFAIGGCDWAIRECASPEFDLDRKVRDFRRRKADYWDKKELDALEKKVAELRTRMGTPSGIGGENPAMRDKG